MLTVQILADKYYVLYVMIYEPGLYDTLGLTMLCGCPVHIFIH